MTKTEDDLKKLPSVFFAPAYPASGLTRPCGVNAPVLELR